MRDQGKNLPSFLSIIVLARTPDGFTTSTSINIDLKVNGKIILPYPHNLYVLGRWVTDHKHMLLLIPERPKQNILEIYRNIAWDVDPFVWNTQQFGLAHKYLMGSETGLQQYSDMVRQVNSKGSESK